MNRITFAIAGIFLFAIPTLPLEAQQNVRMEITQLPSYHPTGSDIYIAGSFNGWNPHDEKYKFSKDDQGHYYFDLSLSPGNYEYKITRGGWDKAECKTGGISAQNRSLAIPGDSKIGLTVEEWADRYPVKPKVSTASKNVHILDTAFLIPQLNRTRRIWIYLPFDYDNNASKRYPVLYMQDGQNVFDESTAYAGEWGVDEFMDSLKEDQCIVVAIDHGGEKRMTEYNPYDNKKFGKGEGKLYAAFLAKTLKPFIDKKYRTIADSSNTIIAGSSMGGLISMYTALQYPEVFGKAGIFSPSLWVTDSEIYTDCKKKAGKIKSLFYFYAGRQESETMVSDILRAIDTLKDYANHHNMEVLKPQTASNFNPDGKHNESAWRLAFPLFHYTIFNDEIMLPKSLFYDPAPTPKYYNPFLKRYL